MKVLCLECKHERQERARMLCGGCYNRRWRRGTLPPIGDVYRLKFKQRRMHKTIINPSTGCWEWQGLTDYGYGITSLHSEQEMLHRAAYVVLVGPIPDGMQVRHLCACKKCWNPEHLALGTQADNEQDKRDQGRYAYNQGSGRYNAKLTEDEVSAIRHRAALGESHSVLAKEYGCARPGISRIVSRAIWKHVA